MATTASTSLTLASGLRALTESAAVVDLSVETRLHFRGKDILDLLNRLSTNLLLDLQPLESRGTVLTSDRGRIIAVLKVVLKSPDHAFLLTGAPAATVLDWIDRYTFEEDATLRDISSATCQFAIAGPSAKSAIRAIAREQTAALEVNSHVSATIAGVPCDIIRSDLPSLACYRVIAPAAHRDGLARVIASSCNTATTAAWDALRIKLGVPAHGAELTEDFNPLEAGLGGLVSFTKGCYIGQEVVARLDTYDKVQRVLVRISSPGPLEAGDNATLNGDVAGRITSAADWPLDNTRIALAYVGRKSLDTPGGDWRVNGHPVSF